MDSDLRQRRLDAGLSQQRLAELARCSVQMVRVLEGGMRPTSSAVLSRIELVLAEHEARSDHDAPDSGDVIGRAA